MSAKVLLVKPLFPPPAGAPPAPLLVLMVLLVLAVDSASCWV